MPLYGGRNRTIYYRAQAAAQQQSSHAAPEDRPEDPKRDTSYQAGEIVSAYHIPCRHLIGRVPSGPSQQRHEADEA